MTFHRCEICGLGYDDSFEEDLIRHRIIHARFVQVEATLGFKPRTYEDREALKRLAFKKLSSKEEDEQLIGALDLIRSHFDRSLADAIIGDYWMEHPNFFDYIAMIDYAFGTIPDKIMKKIRKTYKKRPGEIPKGDTYWYPPNSDARKKQFQAARRT